MLTDCIWPKFNGNRKYKLPNIMFFKWERSSLTAKQTILIYNLLYIWVSSASIQPSLWIVTFSSPASNIFHPVLHQVTSWSHMPFLDDCAGFACRTQWMSTRTDEREEQSSNTDQQESIPAPEGHGVWFPLIPQRGGIFQIQLRSDSLKWV